MNWTPPNKTAQIEALLHFKAYDLVKESIGTDQPVADYYSKVFTVTRQEIEDYAKHNYKLSDFAFLKTAPGQKDGFYAIRISGGYNIYDQERGIRFDKALVQSEDDIWHLLIDYILLRSGTGIKFK